MSETSRRTKGEILVERIETALAQAHDALLDLKRLHAGENPVGQAIAYWLTSWKGRYGKTYELLKGDSATIKRRVNQHGVGEVCARFNRYLNNREPWLVRNEHPLGWFWKQESAYATVMGEVAEDCEPPIDCRHEPPCRNEAEHTARRTRDDRLL